MAAGVAILVIISAGFTYLLAKYLRILHYMGKFHGPPAHPIFGNLTEFKNRPRKSFLDVTKNMDLCREKSGGLMRIWIGPMPVLIVYGAKHIEELMGKMEFTHKSRVYGFLEPWLGKGLLTSAGEKWFHRRKLLTPTFHFSILQNFISVFNEQSNILVKNLEKYADKPDPINIIPFITYCTLDIISDTAMGKNINAQGEGENEYVKAVSRMSNIIMNRGRKPWLYPSAVFSRTEDGKEHEKCLNILHGVTNKMIQERLKEPPRCANVDEKEDDVGGRWKKIAFLDLLLQVHREDPSFTLENIREEVDTFMFEGHDTTATTADWAILMLGIHQDVQTRVQEELDDIFGKSDRPVTSEDLPKLSYLACVIKETLRLVPTVPAISRDLSKEITLDGKLITKGTTVAINFYGLHHDPEQFPEPDRFDPDRFLPENSVHRHPYAYTPFSAGSRNCIGQRFAMMEEKVLLANLLRKFNIVSMQTLNETNPAGQLVLRPLENEIMIKLHSRR